MHSSVNQAKVEDQEIYLYGIYMDLANPGNSLGWITDSSTAVSKPQTFAL